MIKKKIHKIGYRKLKKYKTKRPDIHLSVKPVVLGGGWQCGRALIMIISVIVSYSNTVCLYCILYDIINIIININVIIMLCYMFSSSSSSSSSIISSIK